MQLTQRQRGIAICSTGVFLVTPDAVLTRWAQRLGASAAAYLFWKFMFVCVFSFAFVCDMERRDLGTSSPRVVVTSLARRAATSWRHFCAAALLQASLDSTFSLALLLTYAANVLIFFSLNMLWSAILGSLLLGDRLPRRTVAAIGFALACVALVFFSQLGDGDGGDPLGDALAVFTGMTMSVYLCNARHAARVAPEVPIALAAGFGSLLAAGVVALSTVFTGDDVWASAARTPLLFLVLVLDGLAVTAIFVGMALAPRYIQGAECGLCSLMETILGPLWVFLVFGELPPVLTLVGGSLLIAALAAHEYASARAGAEPGDPPPKATAFDAALDKGAPPEEAPAEGSSLSLGH